MTADEIGGTGTRPLRVLTAYGTRPEAIKLAPLIAALGADSRFESRVAVTGQHREMLDQVHQVFGIVPEADLNLLRAGQGLGDITARAITGMQTEIARVAPDAVVVQGDTTTTFACALAAFYAGVPVIHVEAGLRTFDRFNPFPEEMNRRLTTQLASLHLAPTPQSRDNLLAEAVPPELVVVTGNTVIDALLHTVAARMPISVPRLAERLDLGRPTILVTAHRRESWGEPMRQIGDALAALARRHPGHDIVFPMHRNPVVREAIGQAVEGLSNVLLIEPLGYADFCALLDRSAFVLTDSGGVQEEAPSLGKPVLVLRGNTERGEAVAAGTVKLIGTATDRVVSEASALIEDPARFTQMARRVNPYGDGHAARRCVEAIAHFFGRGEPSEEFAAATADAATPEDAV